MRRHVHFLVGILGGGAACASPQPMSGDAIRQAVAGATIRLDTPLGAALPVAYSEDGKISSEAGSLAFYLGANSDRGRWWIVRDRLCHKWTKWFDGETQCLTIRQDGHRLSWRRDDGTSGTATLVSRPMPVPAPEPLPPAYALGGPPAAIAADVPISEVTAASTPASPRPNSNASAPTQPPLPEPKQAARPLPREAAAQVASAPRIVAPSLPGQSQTESAASPQPPTYRVWGVSAHDVLNVRSGPASGYPAVGTLVPGSGGVRISGNCMAGWCPIRHGAIHGWVNRALLVEEVRSENSAAVAIAPQPSAPRRPRSHGAAEWHEQPRSIFPEPSN